MTDNKKLILLLVEFAANFDCPNDDQQTPVYFMSAQMRGDFNLTNAELWATAGCVGSGQLPVTRNSM
jgi:hypothetical protein